MNLLNWLESRKLIYQKTNESNLSDQLEKKQICAYLGADLTASSLHIGHLLPLRILKILSEHGCKSIFLFGRGTTMIGDPSLRTKERPMLSQEEIYQNMNNIKPQVDKLIKNVIYEDNANWLLNTNLIDFLREVGSKFSVNQMVNLETFKNRIENNNPLSFLEFSYPILQSYDFYHLNKNHGCNLQIGGSDQWGNIINGVHFIKKMTSKETYGITLPLLLKGGKKMGKSVGGAIWLDEKQTSVFDFWQFWRNLPDSDVEDYLLKFTDIPHEEIKDMVKNSINDAKKKIADYLTSWVHGEEKTKNAKEKSISIFENKNMNSLDEFKLDDKQFSNSEIKLTKLLVEIGLSDSASDAKRKIKNNSITVNSELIEKQDAVISKNDFDSEIIVGHGKKKKIKVVLAK
ncbi:tyrosine--tRNA ligase [Candidatus Cytomitobacter indipagum]|uniref:Tyrosine--tRNA ligase n=1 Tax=Candidatus Cytomitobacter indipagum TaxID=2601575 RepID=A0A5C0UFF1_9PROT|nr:tyrosine--tRNA ligase [Candidatus Cytomitobacter indipagum]QEK37992.1 tyrosine--tRNA ligase [Candidatus Cytomitobacter indipagum]